MKITRLEVYQVRPRWTFPIIYTDAGITGLGEPIVESRGRTVIAAVQEIEPYLIGKDPRRVVHHWQAIYRHAFYRGGPVLTSALSGIGMALRDIKGKALGVPVHELPGGPTRRRVRVYSHARTPEDVRQDSRRGFTAFKTGVPKQRPFRYVETPKQIAYAAERFAELRAVAGKDCDIAIDFHGAIPPAAAKQLVKELEPYQPMFIEEPCQAQNHDVMAEIARGTHLPIATGERVFTKWRFRRVLEARAASILRPDLCHAGGDHRMPSHRRHGRGLVRLHGAAQSARTHLASCRHPTRGRHPELSLPEQVSLGGGYLKQPFAVRDGYVDVPTAPGLGIELDDEAVDRLRGHSYRPDETYGGDDGSVVDR